MRIAHRHDSLSGAEAQHPGSLPGATLGRGPCLDEQMARGMVRFQFGKRSANSAEDDSQLIIKVMCCGSGDRARLFVSI
jgi:hypothetical protein